MIMPPSVLSFRSHAGTGLGTSTPTLSTGIVMMITEGSAASNSPMRVVIHPSVPFMGMRFRIWQSKVAMMGLELIKYTPGLLLVNGDKLLVGADCTFLDQQLLNSLPAERYMVVYETWLQACMSAGTSKVPILPHVVPVKELQPPAPPAAAAKQGDGLLKSNIAAAVDGNSDIVGPSAATKDGTGSAEGDGRLLKRPRYLPPSSAATYSAAQADTSFPVTAEVLDALRVISGRRLWIPSQQQQQQQSGSRLPQMLQQQQQQQQQDLLIYQQQQRPLPKLDVSWMSSTAIRVVTYNILADMYCSKGHSKSYCPVQLRDWSSRWPRLAAELAGYQPHLLCLQEVDDHLWFRDAEPWLRQHLNMQGLAWCRNYKRNQGANEGIALCFDRCRFKLVCQHSVRFADHIPHSIDPALSVFWQSVKDYEEGAIFALLQCTSSGKLLVTCCTHLWYSPRTPDIKVGQAEILCKCCVDFIQQQCRDSVLAVSSSKTAVVGTAAADTGATENTAAGHEQQVLLGLLEHAPVIMGGDFNSLWRKYKTDAFDRVAPAQYQVSGVYELLSVGRLHNSHPHHPSYRHGHNRNSKPVQAGVAAAAGGSSSADGFITAAGVAESSSTSIQNYVFTTHGLKLQSSYLAARGYEPALTNKHPGFAGCLDYVWYTSQTLKVAGTLAMPYETLGFSNVPEDPERVPFVNIPDDVWPSDHLAVGAVFDLT